METKSIENAASPAVVADSRLDPQQIAERRALVKAIKAINASELFGENYELTFVLDRQSRRPVMRIVDRETREVIRQLPPEYTLRLAEEAGTK